MSDNVLRTVARYDLLEVLGRGGMAVVYLARQVDLGRLVALKELSTFRAEDPEFVRRFVRESQLAGSLAHPNIVTVHDYLVHENVPYIAMEYVARGSLRPYMGSMGLAQIAGVLEGMLKAVAHANERGIVHRDIKPENVMVTADGWVKVADFGIAKAIDHLEGQSLLTADGMAVGTPAYMAPEQALAADLGPATDQYSVGVVAYEMLVGQRPFIEPVTPAAALLRLINTPVPPPMEVKPTLDAGLAGWIERVLQKDPSDRYPDAGDAWDDLEEHVIRLLGPRWRRAALLRVDTGTNRTAPLPQTTGRAGPGVPGSDALPVGTTALLTPPDAHAASDPPTAALTIPGPWTPPPGRAATKMPDSWPTHDPESDRVSRRPKMPGRRMIAGAAGLLMAAGAGLVLLTSSSSDPADRRSPVSSARPAREPVVSSRTVRLRAPRGWRRLTPVAAVPGLRLTQRVALASTGAARTEVVGGLSQARGRTLLSGPGIRVAGSLPAGATVKLGTVTGLRYTALRLRGSAALLDVYVVPTTVGVVNVVCRGQGDRAPDATACATVASSLELLRGRAFPPGPDATFAKAAKPVLASLAAGRATGERKLRAASTAARQADAAGSLKTKYERAYRRLRNITVSPLDADLRDIAVRRLEQLADTHGALAGAARRESALAYGRARTRAMQALKRLGRAIDALRAGGYSGIPALDDGPGLPKLAGATTPKAVPPEGPSGPVGGPQDPPGGPPDPPSGLPDPPSTPPRTCLGEGCRKGIGE